MFNKIQKNVENMLEFPPDVVGNEPKITIHGRQRILVENFIDITSLSDTEIFLQTTIGTVSICGKGLVLCSILPTEIEIEGTINSLSFEEGGKE